jgi:hypothetical protein
MSRNEVSVVFANAMKYKNKFRFERQGATL